MDPPAKPSDRVCFKIGNSAKGLKAIEIETLSKH
jgi:hypothetical protein